MNYLPCYLIGLPGSGKSFLGRRLAQLLQLSFLDTDVWIEEQAGMTIETIFEKKGEAIFRDWETCAIAAVPSQSVVVACGGGLPLIPEMMATLLNRGCVVWMDTDLSLIEKRLVNNLAHRPLLQPHASSLSTRLKELFVQRSPTYSLAHHRETVLDENPEVIVQRISNLYRSKFIMK